MRAVVQHAAGGHSARVHLDVAGYRERRREALAGFVTQIAGEVLEAGTERALEPMNPPTARSCTTPSPSSTVSRPVGGRGSPPAGGDQPGVTDGRPRDLPTAPSRGARTGSRSRRPRARARRTAHRATPEASSTCRPGDRPPASYGRGSRQRWRCAGTGARLDVARRRGDARRGAGAPGDATRSGCPRVVRCELPGSRWVTERAEAVAHGPGAGSGCDLVTARGFGAPALTAEIASGLVEPGGWLVVSEPPEEDAARWPAAGLGAMGFGLRSSSRTPRAPISQRSRSPACRCHAPRPTAPWSSAPRGEGRSTWNV